MASIRPATRYTNTLSSPNGPDPSSSSESCPTSREASRALARRNGAPNVNLATMVRKLVEGRKTGSKNPDRGVKKLVIAVDAVAADLKKNGKKSSGLGGAHTKLFSGGSENTRKALAEVKGNTRTVAMVLRSERELLIMNKEQDEEISRLKVSLMKKNTEVEKLKDLCLKQREEITTLKSAVLFPDSTSSQLQGLLEQQGSELQQAKQLIPSLQRQVTSLKGRLQSLADDVAEVKADKYSGRGVFDNRFCSPMTPLYDRHAVANPTYDQEYNSDDYTAPDSPDEMILRDLNPCLTPCSPDEMILRDLNPCLTPCSPDEMILRDLNPCLTPCYPKTKSKALVTEFDIYSSHYDKVDMYNTDVEKGAQGFYPHRTWKGDAV